MTRLKASATVAVPVGVLTVAGLAICIRFGTRWPWNAVVHEDGHRTLLQTVFYFEHALGELPLEWLLSAAIAAGVAACGPPSAGVVSTRWLIVLALAADAVIVVGALVAVGAHESLSWFLQYRTREGAAANFGSHWRYHLLSEASLMLGAAALAGTVFGRSGPLGRLWPATWIAFAGLTTVFGLSAAPFVDPRFLGHEARETFTHALVTVPLAVGMCGVWSRRHPSRSRASSTPLWLGCSLIGLYQLGGVALARSADQAQTHDLMKLVAGHFFEHSFSYLVVASHSALFVRWMGRGENVA